jgi:fatty acid amide hydrolase 2
VSALLDTPVTRLAEMVRSGAVSPLELVDAHVARIRAVDPLLNALTADRFEAARAEAAAAGEVAAQARARGEAAALPPLHGIPCTIKEFLSVEGMPWTGGMKRRADVRAERDAVLVRRLRAAGAIVLGTSNVPEGGLWMETYNAIYGRTRNPWDLGRSPGGSSGGEGALVAAGASPFGIGTDVGGSIRIPSAFCGIPGHKPTGLLVPNDGHFPPATGDAEPYLCAGPMGRSIDDLALVLGVIAGPDPASPAVHRTFGGPEELDLRDVTVVPFETNGRMRVREVMRGAVRRSAEALAARGATVKEVDVPALRHAFEIWSAMLSAASEVHYATVLGGEDGVQFAREFLAMPFGRSRFTFAGLALTAADSLTQGLGGTVEKFVALGAELQAELESVLGPRGVLLHPPYSRPAPRHRDSWRTPFDAACTAIFNVLELPVTVVPVGFEHRGLPLGVQVGAARGNDALTLAVAKALEEDFGGWVRAEPRA